MVMSVPCNLKNSYLFVRVSFGGSYSRLVNIPTYILSNQHSYKNDHRKAIKLQMLRLLPPDRCQVKDSVVRAIALCHSDGHGPWVL